jgi:hypothetical protein
MQEMKSPVVLAGIAVVLLACSTASAGWAYVGPVVVPPPTVVHSFYPVGPVYAYPAPVVAVPPRVVYRPPVVVPAPVVYPPPVVYRPPVAYPAPVFYGPAAVYPAPVVIHPKIYVRGQPVRNVIRAVLP